ncbi:MAG: AAA family ATPase, partial [Aggregatilineales bacterium]
MLEELRIQNFAIIDTLDLSFDGGFNVITGETGAGKSIIIDAVELLLGHKADAGSVRAGADKTVIEGVFALHDRSRIQVMPILELEDLLDDDDELPDSVTLSREIRKTGRSTARINGITVRLDVLREVGEILVDIHGQSAHLSLFKPRAHMDLLDRFANLLDARSALAEVVTSLSEIRSE